MTGYPKGAAQALGWMLTLAVLIGAVPAAVADVADHLIISEIVVKTRAPFSSFGSPYIQVVNPTGSDVNMGQVYITDATTSPSAFYYNLPLGDPAAHNPGGGNGGDFHARFPDGYILAAGDSLAISINGSTEYQEAYGRMPDFELFEDSNILDTVPELVEVFPGSIGAGPHGGSNVPVLSDIAESLVLYTWDGTSDLVQDLDYVMWGTNTGVRYDKSDVTIGSGTYADDTLVISQDAVASAGPGFRHSFRRVDADEGLETTSGGNGIGGDDETSENMDVTWQDVDTGGNIGVPSAPGSLHPAAPIFTAVEASPSVPSDGEEAELTASVLSNSAISAVTFHYTVDGGAEQTLAASLSGDDYVATLPGQVEGAVVVWFCVAENNDGGSSVYPSAAPAFTSTWTVDPAPLPGSGAEKLLITEVSVDPDDLEYIEIHNPNTYSVTMSDYYLTDAIYYSSSYGNQLYWQIAGITPTRDDVGGGNFNDFTARFPDGYAIAAGQTVVIAVQGSNGFESYFGFLPDLELYEDGTVADSVPDFRPVFINPGSDQPGNSIYTPNRSAGSDGRPRGIPELEEYFGEPVILYHYAEGDDFVTDIDIVIWRHTVGDFPFTFDKTGVTNGGHTYLPDTPVDDQKSAPQQVDLGESYNRITSDRGFQPSSGSNGVAGRDETGEDLATSIQVSAFSPGVYDELTIDTSSNVKIIVEAKTFIPTMGETFSVNFVSDLEYETKVRIFDLEGRVIITLYDSRRDGQAGMLNGVDWDGRDSVYERVKAGLYIIHLSAVDPASGELHTTTAPVVVATRLSR